MWVRSLALDDFRSYPHVECQFTPGFNVLLGRNGQGKTNILEAIAYVATHRSHRAATDAILVRREADRALIGCEVDIDGQGAAIDLAIIPGRANRARLNRVNLNRAVDALGLLRTVTFAPEDLALVKGDPGVRRAFLDDLLVQQHPRMHARIADFDRSLRQRNALLKSARERRVGADTVTSSLAVWDEQVAQSGGALVDARLTLVRSLQDPLHEAYEHITDHARVDLDRAQLHYRSSWLDDDVLVHGDEAAISESLSVALQASRSADLARGVTTVGPQRDDIDITLDGALARSFASHGESWSLALALRLASYRLLSEHGPAPVLLLDDVFAELDSRRRDSLVNAIEGADQIIVTAAVEGDVPVRSIARIFDVADGAAHARLTQ